MHRYCMQHIILKIESQTQMLRAEAVAELRQCDYGDTFMVIICSFYSMQKNKIEVDASIIYDFKV